jgi:predicted phage tail protein
MAQGEDRLSHERPIQTKVLTGYRHVIDGGISGLPNDDYEVRMVVTAGYPQSYGFVNAAKLDPAPLEIRGKTTAQYERAYRIPLPAGGAPWDIRVRRLKGDSQSAKLNDEMAWAGYTKLVESKISYRNSAVCGMAVNAALFGTRIPARSYDVFGLICKVPNNYDAFAHSYDGIWDGTFKESWTNNPAWVLYDLITNTRYGLGEDIDPELTDKWGLYEIGRYCDEMVPDGRGGQEPRFAFNGVINTREDAYNVINSIASSFRGLVYWAAGRIAVAQDRPGDSVRLISPSNVIGGSFNYEGAALKARHTAVFVTWNNPEDGYKPDIAIIEDRDLIRRFGYKRLDIVAYGCTSEGQAHRAALWALETERTQTEICSWQASFDQADLKPGDLVSIADPSYAEVRNGGRIKAIAGTMITLDAPVTIEAGSVLNVLLADGSIQKRPVITGSGETDILEVESAFDPQPLIGAQWILEQPSVNPRPFRIQSIVESEKNVFEFTAALHDPTKYDYIDYGIKLPQPDYSAQPSGPLLPPTEIKVEEYLYRAGVSVKAAASVSWNLSADPRIKTYELQYQSPSQTGWVNFGFVAGTNAEISEVEPGRWLFRVRGLDGLGRKSKWMRVNLPLLALSRPPSDIEDMFTQIKKTSIRLTWPAIPDLDLDYYKIRYSPLMTGYTWENSIDAVDQTKNTHASVPKVTGTFLLKAFDTSGNESVNAIAISLLIPARSNRNIIQVLDESGTWPGSKSNLAVIDSELVLTSDDPMSIWPTFSSIDKFMSAYGVNGIEEVGTYVFSERIDVGEIWTSNLFVEIDAYAENISDIIYNWPTLSEIGLFSGVKIGDWSIIPQVRSTNDDPNGVSPSWSRWQPFSADEYNARGFQFRLRFQSRNPDVSPRVRSVKIIIDVEDRIESGADVLCPIGGINVDFNGTFRESPSLVVTGQGLSPGDYFEITNKTTSSFDIIFKNSGGTSVARTFDWQARGYGRMITP